MQIVAFSVKGLPQIFYFGPPNRLIRRWILSTCFIRNSFCPFAGCTHV